MHGTWLWDAKENLLIVWLSLEPPFCVDVAVNQFKYLSRANHRNWCHLQVVPLSTFRGKGSWGGTESIDAIYKTSLRQRAWYEKPQHYQRVQRVLQRMHAFNASACTVPLPNDSKPGFSGFFFALRKSVAGVALSSTELWPPTLRNLGQEGNLYQRLRRAGGYKMCLNVCSFVYHFKGGTIPLNVDRDKWMRADHPRPKPTASSQRG